MSRIRLISLALAALPLSSLAVETKTWLHSSQVDYEKAEVKGLSLRSDGRITLAPAFREIFDSSAPYLWALAEDSKGNLYAGGGGSGGSTAKLFQIDAHGKSKVLAELDGLEIHAIAIDKKDRVYAATAPDGRIYRLSAAGKAEVFYDPKAKYIWAIAFDSKQNLFVATGDAGEIHKVTPDGKGSVFAKTEEVHVRSMVVDKQDNLIAGTEPGGLILRVSPAGEGFVLHQASKREVTAVAVAADGSIYAAAVGGKTQLAAPVLPPAPVPAGPAAASSGPQQVQPTGRPAQALPPTLGPVAGTLTGGSEVWRIAADGAPRKLWSDSQEVVYALAFDAQARLLIGTGNKGNVHRLDDYPLSTLLVNAAPTQVLVFASGRNGRLHLATGNIGKVFQLGPELEQDGRLESEALDAAAFSRWGRISFEGKPEQGSILLESRSGNLDRPQKNWSPWSPVPISGDGGRVASPASRFLQYRLTLKAGANGMTPRVDSIAVAYLPQNVAPVFEEIEATPANYRFPSQSVSLTIAPSQSITLPPLGHKKRQPSSVSLSPDSSSPSMQYAKGYVGVRWLAADENGDTLTFKVEIRGVKEGEWKPLKDKLRDKYYAWDSTAFPDGEYQLRVTASDAPSNPPASALSASFESDPLLIDNTPPQILDLKGALAGTQITVTWRAKDALNLIGKAEYSLDGGEWLVAEPVTRLTDAQELDYKLVLTNLPKGEQTVAVRVADDFDNQAVEKVVVR
jgi:sugar lactone lactonase YvrE